MLKDLIINNRSCRRFYQDIKVDLETLRELVNLARLSPSARNLQPLKYILSTGAEKNELIFSCLAWAGYIKDWSVPESERPAAYILMLGDKKIASSFAYDAGIAAQSILLGAREKGLAGCILGSVQKEKIRGLLKIPEQYEVLLVIALGKPKEKAVLEEVGPDGDIKYWRDAEGIHHVPKRRLDELIVGSF
ncbi:MAG: nitroreductase family protein [Bacillota bacterium]